MSNDLMPMLFYVLYTEDLKKQGDRVIQAVRDDVAARNHDYEMTVEVGSGADRYLEAAQRFMDSQLQSSAETRDALLQLTDRIAHLEKAVTGGHRPDLPQSD